MPVTSCFGLGLSPSQLQIFKLSVSCACRRMTANQILDVADQLHDIIRKRSSIAGSLDAAIHTGVAVPVEQAPAP